MTSALARLDCSLCTRSLTTRVPCNVIPDGLPAARFLVRLWAIAKGWLVGPEDALCEACRAVATTGPRVEERV